MSSASIVTSMRTSAEAGGRRGREEIEAEAALDWVGLEAQPLERPVAALLDTRRYPGEWRETAEGATATGELERGDVVLHPVVVSGERRRPEQVDGPIGTDEPAAGQSGGRSHRDQEESGDQGAAGSVDRTHVDPPVGPAGAEWARSVAGRDCRAARRCSAAARVPVPRGTIAPWPPRNGELTLPACSTDSRPSVSPRSSPCRRSSRLPPRPRSRPRTSPRRTPATTRTRRWSRN